MVRVLSPSRPPRGGDGSPESETPTVDQDLQEYLDDDPAECSCGCREPMDSWLDDGEEPITITTSIEKLQSTQDKTLDRLDKLCSTIEDAERT